MTPLCKYRDMFGKPREGVHQYRLFDVAIVDTVLALLLAWAVSVATSWSLWACILGTLLAGIVVHRLFCVRTKIDGFLEKLTMTLTPP